MDEDAWRDDSICKDLPRDIFYESGRDWTPKEAKSICAQCPVMMECFWHAVENNERYGVWGHTDEVERYSVAIRITGMPREAQREAILYHTRYREQRGKKRWWTPKRARAERKQHGDHPGEAGAPGADGGELHPPADRGE